MNILVYKWDIFPYQDIINTFKKQGHSVDVLAFPIYNHLSDPDFEKALLHQLQQTSYDLVFSVNYYTVIAVICRNTAIPYAAWTCDSPLLSLQNESVLFSTSYIFCFDRAQYEDLIRRHAPHAFYLPLAGIILPDSYDSEWKNTSAFSYDISFVGNLYDKNRYDEMCEHLPDYLCGYMDAAIEAQLRICSGNLLPNMLNDDILTQLQAYTTVEHGNASLEELRIHFATTVLSYKAAAESRTGALNALSNTHAVHLFTTSDTRHIPCVHCHPAADYHTQAPRVFAQSKINLNFTIPNIENGIPLRVFDVLSAGGFLLTDYRKELCQQFENQTDLVVFENTADLLQKADYYLTHEKERQQIAKNGQKKVQHFHQYDQRLTKILHSVFNL